MEEPFIITLLSDLTQISQLVNAYFKDEKLKEFIKNNLDENERR